MHLFLIADNHQTTRFGLIEIISSSFTDYYIEEAKNGKQVFEILETKTFDILILDPCMPETDPVRFVQTILAIQPGLKVLVLSTGWEGQSAPIYFQKGAMGYIGKDKGLKELMEAIRTVLDGGIYIGPDLIKSFITGQIMKKGNPFLALTQRESEICTLICQGMGLTEIAASKQLAVSTVGTYKSNILRKVGAENLVDLFNKARFHSFLY